MLGDQFFRYELSISADKDWDSINDPRAFAEHKAHADDEEENEPDKPASDEQEDDGDEPAEPEYYKEADDDTVVDPEYGESENPIRETPQRKDSGNPF